MATLPKPRYPSEPHGPEARRAQGMRPPVSRNTSLLGLQPEIPVVGSQLATSEPGPLADVGVRLEQWAERLERVGKLLRRVGQWWVAADLRHCQLPILVLALGIWAISARVAWQSEESGRCVHAPAGVAYLELDGPLAVLASQLARSYRKLAAISHCVARV